MVRKKKSVERKKRKVAKEEPPKQLLKLDLGCGPRVEPGFDGVDQIDFGQKHVVDLRQPWPFADESVEEVRASHFVEHLTGEERIHFINELYRVLIPGGKAQIITPHWASCRAYGDLTHQWPPVSEFWFYYLNRDWRAQNAPHNDGYRCHFEAMWGYTVHPELLSRNVEFQSDALQWKKEAAQDLVANLVKR